MRAAVALLVALAGCFDFDAAGRCFRGGSGCPGDAGAGGMQLPADAAAAGADGAAGGGASLCAGLAVQLCEGFEDAALGAPWSPDRQPAGSSVAIDRSRAFRGAGSLHVHTEGVAARGMAIATIQEERTEAASLPERWVRAFVFFSGAPSGAINLISLAQVEAPFHAITLGLEAGALVIDNEFAPGRTVSGAQLTGDRWACLEVAVRVGDPGEIRVRLDGQEVEDLHLTQRTSASPPIGDVEIGLVVRGEASPADVWYDELLVDGAETSCAR